MNLKHRAEELTGKFKRSVGRFIGDPAIERTGRRQQRSGRLKRAGDSVKHAFRQ